MNLSRVNVVVSFAGITISSRLIGQQRHTSSLDAQTAPRSTSAVIRP
jgi:hypothetical protein